MKKNYFMLVCLALFMAVSAKAQVNSIADLIGNYKFTADVEYVDEAYRNVLPKECDATIEKDYNYSGCISGFAGSEEYLFFNINASGEIEATNFGGSPMWGTELFLANKDGDNPYGVFADGEWVVEKYNTEYYTYDAETKVISIPNFTVVKVVVHTDEKAVIVAKYTNVKMTFVGAEEGDIADISGEWVFTAGDDEYATKPGSTLPSTFAITLANGSDNNSNYTATIAVEGYNNVELPATFNGETLEIAYDNQLLDAESGIYFVPTYGYDMAGVIAFNKVSNSKFELSEGFGFANADGEFLQFYQFGSIVRTGDDSEPEGPEVPVYDWAGSYTVKVGDIDVYDDKEYPNEFTMTIVEDGGYLLVTEFLNNDVAFLNNGGLIFNVAADGKSAEMEIENCLVGGDYPNYLAIYDMNSGTEPIVFTLNDDGSITVDNFFLKNYDYSTYEETPAAYYQNVTIPATGGNVESEPFDWLGTWVVTAGGKYVYDSETYPDEFYMTIEENYGFVLITQFMSSDVNAINQGGILLTIADDNKTAEMELGSFAGGEYPDYLKIYDLNAMADYPLILTANEDGTITFEDFLLKSFNWDTQATSNAVFYQNVTATKCPTGIENVKDENAKVKGIFDLQGRKINTITMPGIYIVDGVKMLVK